MAYGSVASLMGTMEPILHSKSPMQSLICDHREEFLALGEKISSLEVFLKNFEKDNYSGKMTELEAQIKEAVNAVEHVIQLRLAVSLRANDEMQKEEARERFCNSLQQVVAEIDHVYNESTKFQAEGKQASNKALVQYSSPNVDKNMVGRDTERRRLVDRLTRGRSEEVKVISILGMGGIGKTTLAKDVYDDASIITSHFDVRAWATVSQRHNVKEILLNLLSSTNRVRASSSNNNTTTTIHIMSHGVGASAQGNMRKMSQYNGKGDKFHEKDESELRDLLRKSLKGKRYLIVMDDMWSINAWDDVRQCFPCENNGSRILLTTRSTDIARCAGTQNLSLVMEFMDSDDSWNLFNRAAFSNETLPSELETIGKKIVEKCQGLPLTIVVVAGLLSKSKRTIEAWDMVADNVMSFVTSDPKKQCLDVLGLSYNHLPGDLKACLLYFGIFPEDSDISVKRLLRLWISEGFLKLDKDLEGEAEKCLQNLIDRCLVFVSKKSKYENKIRSCKVHDLIYEMCLREAQSQNFFIMDNEPNFVPPGSCKALLTPGHHHLISRQAEDDDDNLLSRTRSIFSFWVCYGTFTLPSELTYFNLLRILDLSQIELSCFPQQILCLIWLRYLALFRCEEGIPQEICRLWNLQTLIVVFGFDTPSIFTEQVWELVHLRHLKLNNFCLPNPPTVSDEEEKYLGFSNVHTIQGLSPSSCTKEVISGIRNVKKLEICGKEYDCRLFNNLVYLHHLETLSFTLLNMISHDIVYSSSLTIPSANVFPATLKKLKLNGTQLRWEDLDIIGELPNLEVLKLTRFACCGIEWKPLSGGFIRLKLLLIRSCALKYWIATNDNFPVLERLFVERCPLEEIPIEFANIHSLQLIDLKRGRNTLMVIDSLSYPKLKTSAIRIQQEQQELGNPPVHVRSDGKVVLPGDDDDEDVHEEDDDDVDDKRKKLVLVLLLLQRMSLLKLLMITVATAHSNNG